MFPRFFTSIECIEMIFRVPNANFSELLSIIIWMRDNYIFRHLTWFMSESVTASCPMSFIRLHNLSVFSSVALNFNFSLHCPFHVENQNWKNRFVCQFDHFPTICLTSSKNFLFRLRKQFFNKYGMKSIRKGSKCFSIVWSKNNDQW